MEQMTMRVKRLGDVMIPSMRRVPLILLLLASMSATSCMSGIRLNTESATQTEVSGTYRAIFVGCNYFNDLNTVVVLQKEGSRYIFEPFVPDFNYRIRKGVPAEEGLAASEKFLNCSTSFRNSQLSRIVTPGGEVLGYEIKPIYSLYAYGTDDPLNTDYWLKDDKVVIKIWLDPSVDRMLNDGRERNFHR